MLEHILEYAILTCEILHQFACSPWLKVCKQVVVIMDALRVEFTLRGVVVDIVQVIFLIIVWRFIKDGIHLLRNHFGKIEMAMNEIIRMSMYEP